ncbi:MAG: glutamyl-tRNA reductase [Anaerococcus sp.]|nr:glutamyl-tRNA reductase [Anaerococcus sp.]
MKFLVFGINHTLSSIDLREQVHFTESKIIDAIDVILSGKASEALILSTCNRSEIYLLADDDFTKDDGIDFYQNFFDIEVLSPFIFYYENKKAIYHLLNLSLGRDSIIVGEDQILGQVKDSLDLALSINAAKKYLSYIFREVINFTKKVKTESEVSKTPISTAYIGLKAIDDNLHIKGKKALVVGVGKMGTLSINYLIDYGADISISNWTYKNSLKIKDRYPFIKIVAFEKLREVLDDYDLIITATKSPHTLIKKDFFKESKREKYILDLALPRDVDKDVSLIENINLYNIDRLKEVADINTRLRKDILDSYDDDIKAKACEIYTRINDLDFSKLLSKIQAKCDKTKDFTISYIQRKVDLDHSQEIKVERIISSALNKVSRDPILKIKNSNMPRAKKEFLLKALEEVYDK